MTAADGTEGTAGCGCVVCITSRANQRQAEMLKEQRQALADQSAELDAARLRTEALLAHCDSIDAAGYDPIVATFGTAAIRAFLGGNP